MFRALLLEETESGVASSIQELDEERLPEGDVTVAVDSLGVLSATIADPDTGVEVLLEVNPLVSLQITPFSPDEIHAADIARVYTVPHRLLDPDRGEERFLARTTRTIFLVSGVSAGFVILLLAVMLRRILRPVLDLTRAAMSVT